MVLVRELVLLEDNSCSKKYSDETEGSEGDERNHQDGHRSLLQELWNRNCGWAVTKITAFCEVRIPIPVSTTSHLC